MRLLKSQSQSGLCAGGCILFAAVFVVIVGAVLWGAVSTYQGAYLMTSPSPRTFGPLPAPVVQDAARVKLHTLVETLRQGRPAEVTFTVEELNAWFFADGKNSDLVDHLRFGTTEDWIVAEVSLPLTFMADVPFMPSFKNRFFDGKIAARLSIEKNELKIAGLDIEGNDHRLPWLFTGQGYRDTVRQTIEQGIRARLPQGEILLSRLDSVHVESGQIVVRFRAGSAA